MNYVFFLDGGAGRVISSIPSFEKFILDHPNDNVSIIISHWDFLFFGNPVLQPRTYNADTKGIFENLIKHAHVVKTIEPYRVPGYFNQQLSLAQAIDLEINGQVRGTDELLPNLHLSKLEEKLGLEIVVDAEKKFKKDRTIVIQPFGRGGDPKTGEVIDEGSRSLDLCTYLRLVPKLSEHFNIITMCESNVVTPVMNEEDKYSLRPNIDLRSWFGVIYNAPYFLGVDSVGQHIARAFNKPGSVILGSTFAVNVSYPDHFQILEKENFNKTYSPIRISGFGEYLANKMNDTAMDFSDEELDNMVNLIINDYDKKVVE